MKQEILDAGWLVMLLDRKMRGREVFEKGNYWLTLDTRHDYVRHDFLELVVRDPALESSRVGDSRSTYFFSFRYKGKETLDAIESLLTW